MTRDDVIRLAREADIIDFRDASDDPHVAQMVDFLQRFADLVAAKEREACAQLIEPKNEPWDWTEAAHDRHEAAMLIRSRGQEAA